MCFEQRLPETNKRSESRPHDSRPHDRCTILNSLLASSIPPGKKIEISVHALHADENSGLPGAVGTL